ncbi:hypothetical protein [Streptomyces montanisoli]|nr:hypothetical protein [Streptomyces montanisoli]
MTRRGAADARAMTGRALMSVPENPDEYVDQDTFGREAPGGELDAETPEADAAEQRADVRDDDAEESPARGATDEADEADRAEQARPAGGGEDDDYR